MSNAIQPRFLTRLLLALSSVPLRFKITIPFLVITVLLAGVATWLVSQSFARTLQERFRGQLVDSTIAANDDLLAIETAQLAGVRAVAQTAGVAEAVVAHDWDGLDQLAYPLVVNSNFALIHILDRDGLPVYGLRALPSGYSKNENAEFTAWMPVAQVLGSEQDELGDKFVGVVDAPWGLTLYTVGPIRHKDELVGAVLVGTPLPDVLTQLQSGTAANITIYQPNGLAALSTLAADSAPVDLGAALIRQIAEAGATRLESRTVTIGGTANDEALGALVLRGKATNWFLGVALPQATGVGQLGPTEIAGWFTLGLLAVIGLGVLVAQLVAAPVSELVRAAAAVASGDLTVQVKEHAQDEIGVLAQNFNLMVRELRQREMMKEVFGQVVSEEVRAALMNDQLGLAGEQKVVTVLFTDIRDFTSLSERYDPHEVVTLLNNYFEVVSSAINQAGGFINKFGGDSTMAVFGAPISLQPGDGAYRALKAAFAIRTYLAEFNARQIELNQPPIRIGIGINTGEVVTGNIGSRNRFEYTVIGDTVNTAARVQSLTSRFNDSNILITEDTRSALGKEAQLLVIDHGDVMLKGKLNLVRVYGVMGMRFTQAEPVFQVGGIPRRDVLEALFLYCKGYSPRLIGLTKNIDPLVIHQWIEGASRLYERSSEELRQEFGLTDAELRRLAFNNHRSPETGTATLMMTEPVNQPGQSGTI